MKEEPNNGASGADDEAGDGGGVIVIKSIEDADTSAVSPFIVSLPSEEGLYAHLHTHTHISFKVCQLKYLI